MDAAAVALITACGTVAAAWFGSRADRRKVREIHDSLGQSNGQGPVTRMNERQLAQLTRIEGQLGSVLEWQGRHAADHTRTN